MRLAPVVLLALPLLAQQRTDCDSEEVTGDRFYDVCGSDRQTLAGYRARIHADVDALRAVQCDVTTESDAVQALVLRAVAFAANELQGDPEKLLALVEGDVMPFIPQVELVHPSDRALLRLERVAADRTESPRSRCWAIRLLHGIRGRRALAPWLEDRSDPVQNCVATLALPDLTRDERSDILAHPNHPLYLPVLLAEQARPEMIAPLCNVASNAHTNRWQRVEAIRHLEDSRAGDCLAALLSPDLWFIAGDRHSVALVIETLAIVDRPRAQKLATRIDTTRIEQLEMRQEVEDTLFFIRTFDPDLPYYDN